MMSIHPRKSLAVLLPLFALLASALPPTPYSALAAQTQAPIAAPAPVVARDTAAEDAALIRQSLQHPIQDDVFYFALPDRFANGAASNNYGDDSGGTSTR